MTLRGEEFLRRFLGHILPTGFVKVHHYGIFAHALKATALKQLRTSLGQRIGELAYATEAILTLPARNTPRPPKPQCPRCGSVELIATEIMPTNCLGQRALKPP